MLASNSHHDRICYLLALLRIHSPDCEHCKAREKYGIEMRKRLEELNWRIPHSLNKGVFDSKPGEAVANPPISLTAQQRKKIA